MPTKGLSNNPYSPPPPLPPFPLPSPEMQQPTPQLHSSFDSRAAHVHFCSHHWLLCRLVLNWIEFLKSFEEELRAPHRGTSLGPFVCGARACSLCSLILLPPLIYNCGSITSIYRAHLLNLILRNFLPKLYIFHILRLNILILLCPSKYIHTILFAHHIRAKTLHLIRHTKHIF